MASDIPRDLLDELGLSAEQLVLVADELPPASRRGLGFARRPVALEDIEQHPQFSAPLKAAVDALVPIHRWEPDSTVVALRVPAEAVSLVRGERRVTAAGLVLLDGGAGICAVRVQTASGEVVVINHEGHVRALRVLADAALEERLRDIVVGSVRVDVPTLDELLEDAGAAMWLRAAAEELASSPRRFDRVAGCGLIARVWGPVDAASRRAFSSGEMTSPRDRAEEWRARLSDDARSELAREMLLAADDWESMFTVTLDRACGGEHDAEAVVAVIHARDDLEAVAWFTAGTRFDSVVRARLDQLDLLAMTRRSELFVFRDAFAKDARLEALGWIASELWWGQLA